MLKRFILAIATAAFSISAFAQITLTTGWNMLGNSNATPVTVSAAFNDPAKITSVWKWNKAASKWAFYAPSLTDAELVTYTQTKGYEILTTIGQKEGYWINAPAATTIGNVPDSSSVSQSVTVTDLQVGWNLMSGFNASPAVLNQTLSNNLTSYNMSITTIWAWDSQTGKWKFYAPSLDVQGGNVLSDYITSKGYVAFSGAINPWEGVWINVSTVPTTTPTSTTPTTTTVTTVTTTTTPATTTTPVVTPPKPIPVFPTSYQNMKGYGLGRINFPASLELLAWGAGDFYQTGEITIFTAQQNYSTGNTTWDTVVAGRDTVKGKSQYISDFVFWKQNADGTLTQISTQKGCLHPRKAVVADFNNDKIPDVFVGCHGYDGNPMPGERSKLLLSDGKGGFTMSDVGEANGFMHGAAAADVNGDGYPDIAAADIAGGGLYFLINQKDGTFKKDTTRIPGIKYAQYFSVELVDVNGDGIVDLLAGGHNFDPISFFPAKTEILYGKADGTFGATRTTIPDVSGRNVVLDYTVVTNAASQTVVYVGRTGDGTGTAANYSSMTLQTFNLTTLVSTVVYDNIVDNTVWIKGIESWVAWWLPTAKGVVPYRSKLPDVAF